MDLWQLLEHLEKFLAAFVLALPIALERERSTRIMGLRTFPLVALASCGYVLVAVGVLGATADDQSRIIQGLMTGMGFIGGGVLTPLEKRLGKHDRGPDDEAREAD